jgi:acyl dehydratase
MTPTTARYLEDLSVGERHTAGPLELTEAESVDFATRYDPQPMHIDAVFAAQGPFHGLIASGWQTCSLVMRLTIEAKLFGSTLVLGLGVDELRWPTPVRPCDSISAEIDVLSITPSKSKPQFGVVRMRSTGRKQSGEVVLSMVTSVWVPRKPA